MISVPVLIGEQVRLEPLATGHAPALLAAAAVDRSTYDLTRVPASIEEAHAYVARALREQAAGTSVPFAVVAGASGQIVGSTRFLGIECWPENGGVHPTVAEIGHTWLATSVQRSGVNTEMKFLMLRYAFEIWQVLRVTFKTDERNTRSRAAIERIGATYEGIRRQHVMASDGTVRNSAYFSLVAAEWPSAREGLVAKLAQHR